MYMALKYIQEHLDQHLSIQDVARHMGYSPWYFCDLFRQFTGSTFSQYVRHQRMQRAALDILDGQKAADVAMKYGYDTQSGFNKAFLKEYGCLPREFRKKSHMFHVQYKERRDSMYQLTDRCAILRNDIVNNKPLNRKILAQRVMLLEEGIYDWIQKGCNGRHSCVASGIVNVIRKSPAFIQDGELLVGYNYADTPYHEAWMPKDTEEDRQLVLEGGFTDEQYRAYLEHHKDAWRYYQFDWHVVDFADMSFLDEYSPKEKALDKEHAALGMCVSDNHSIIAYEQVLKLGFSGLKRRVEKYEAINGHCDMYDAMKSVCDAAGELGEKYARKAEEIAALPETSIARRAELKEIARICRRVPAQPAETFHEALQSLLFAHFIHTWEDGINANSLGRLDQILYPYYKHDIDAGIITREQAFELICCLWIKLYRDYDVQQSCIGGCLADGSDAVNDLSWMMLDATEELDFIRCLSVRFSPRTDKRFITRALEVVGHVQKGVPFFFNDDVMIPALVDAGLSLEDARCYTQIGCVETTIPGLSNPHAVSGQTNLLKALEYVLGNGRSLFDPELEPGLNTGELSSFKTFDEIKAAVLKQIKHILSVSCKKVNAWSSAAAKHNPKPIKSMLVDDCMANCRDFNARGARYDYYQIMLGGVPNLADSLMTIKKLVFEEHKYTLEHFHDQLAADFPDEAFRQECLHKAAKFGNDIDEVDDLAAEIIDYSCDVLAELSKQWGMAFHAQPFTFLWMVDQGRKAAASADGRKRGEIVAYSVSPMQGRDFNGFTALLNSLAKLPTKRCPGTASAIVEVDPKLFTDSNIDIFADILLTAAEKGLSNVQFNTIDADTLRDAQLHPDKYNNLAVRVSGFSQKFNLLSRDLQDHIIGRTKHICL